VKAIAEAVLESMGRLGLMWRLRPATVVRIDDDGTPYAVLDGDTAAIRVNSMVGPVAAHARVMVVTTPPAGNHIVGWAGPPAPGGGPDGLAWAENSSPAVTAQTVVLSVPMVVRPRTAYRVELGGGVTSSAATVQPLFRLVRAGSPTQQLAEFYRYPAFGTPVANCDGIRYFRRNADTPLSATIQLTLETVAGTATHVGAAGRPRYLQITACGEAAKYPHAVAVT
jgi:hypothetical protein